MYSSSCAPVLPTLPAALRSFPLACKQDINIMLLVKHTIRLTMMIVIVGERSKSKGRGTGGLGAVPPINIIRGPNVPPNNFDY